MSPEIKQAQLAGIWRRADTNCDGKISEEATGRGSTFSSGTRRGVLPLPGLQTLSRERGGFPKERFSTRERLAGPWGTRKALGRGIDHPIGSGSQLAWRDLPRRSALRNSLRARSQRHKAESSPKWLVAGAQGQGSTDRACTVGFSAPACQHVYVDIPM